MLSFPNIFLTAHTKLPQTTNRCRFKTEQIMYEYIIFIRTTFTFLKFINIHKRKCYIPNFVKEGFILQATRVR